MLEKYASYTVQGSENSRHKFSNKRTYSPSVTIFADRNLINEGDKYVTRGIDVTYEGDPEQLVLTSDGENFETVEITDLSNVTALVEVSAKKTVTLNGQETDAYTLLFKSNIVTLELWYPIGGLSGGMLGFAKGIGVITVNQYDATSTNVDM